MNGAALDMALRRARARRGLPPPDVRRLLRESAGLSQQDLANVLGVTRPTITRYESGLRSPRGPRLTEYEAVLGRLAAEASGEASR